MNSRNYLLGVGLLFFSGCEVLWGGFYKDPPSNTDMQSNGDLQNNVTQVDWKQPPTHLWSLRLGGMGDDDGSGVAIDPNGNVVVVGVLGHDGPGATFSAGASDPQGELGKRVAGAYLLKISPEGVVQWAKTLPLVTSTTPYIAKVAVDDDGNVYVAWTLSGATPGNAVQLMKYQPDGKPGWGGPYTFGSTVDLHTLVARTFVDADSQRKTWLAVAGNCGGNYALPNGTVCKSGAFVLDLTDMNGPVVSNQTAYYEFDTAMRTDLVHATLDSDRSVVWTGSGTTAQSRSLLVRQRDGKRIDLGGANATIGGDLALDLASALDRQGDSFVAVRFTDTVLRKYATSQLDGAIGPFINFPSNPGSDIYPLYMVVDGGDNPLLVSSFIGSITLPDKNGSVQLSATPPQRDIFLVKYDNLLAKRLWALPIRVGTLTPITTPPPVVSLAADSRRNRVAVLMHSSQGAGYTPLDGTGTTLNPPAGATGNDIILLYLGTP